MSNVYPPDAAAADDDADGEQTSVAQPVHPASAEAGSWSRSMVLLSNLRGRLHAAGRRNYDHYSTRAADLVSDATASNSCS